LRNAFLAFFDGRGVRAELFAVILSVVLGFTATTGDDSLPAPAEVAAALRKALLAFFEG